MSSSHGQLQAQGIQPSREDKKVKQMYDVCADVQPKLATSGTNNQGFEHDK